jgi:hypothetical protein
VLIDSGETHTLATYDPLDLEMVLADVGSDGAWHTYDPEYGMTSDQPEVISWLASSDQAALFNGDDLNPHASTGMELPDVDWQRWENDLWRSTSPLGKLATRTIVSSVTGCWSVIKGREWNGYVRVYGNFGLERPKQGRDWGVLSHQLAYILLKKHQDEDPTLPRGMELDHICRNPACCNPHHLTPVSGEKNKQLMAKAHKVENHLALGQLMLGPTGLDWLDQHVGHCEVEDTSLVVATRFGPFKILKLDESVIEGQRIPCEVFDALQTPPISKYVPKSRAKKTTIIDGQKAMFVHNRFKRKQRPTIPELYDKARKS